MKHEHTKLKRETDNSTIVGEFGVILSVTDRITRKKINKEIGDLNNSVKQLDLTNIQRIFHPTVEYIFFSRALGISSMKDNMQGHEIDSINVRD